MSKNNIFSKMCFARAKIEYYQLFNKIHLHGFYRFRIKLKFINSSTTCLKRFTNYLNLTTLLQNEQIEQMFMSS